MIAIIPARGGSKGLPGKNTKILCGKPMIVYTIESALKSKYIHRVIVSTDDEEIAKIAKENGAEVPFMRPIELASDNSSAIDVYLYTIERLNSEYGESLEDFMVLLPTSPLRNEVHIDESYELFLKEQAKTLVSVTELHSPIEWLLNMDKTGRIHNADLSNKVSMMNRQEYTSFYEPNGAIYILNYSYLKNDRSYYSDNTIPYIMKSLDSVDIDSFDDFKIVEALLFSRKNNFVS